MNKSELKNLINEAINEAMNESAPPNFPRALEKKLLAKYKDTPQKAYATMWTIHNKKNEGDQRVCEMWMAWESKDVKMNPDEDPLYVEYLSKRAGEEPFMMGGTKWEFVTAKYPNGKRDIGVYSFAEDMTYGYNAFRQKFNLSENDSQGPLPVSIKNDHDETDMTNPEEKKEVQIANKIKKLADELLKMHGK
jgi:hypothetical protein